MTVEERWSIKTDIHTEEGVLTVSTVELMSFSGIDIWQGKPYETCIFHANGESDVVERYATKELALDAHAEWVAQYS